MAKAHCGFCRLLRTVLVAALLGVAGGFGAHALGAGSEASMLATFVGAILPLLWYQRRSRVEKGDIR